MNQELLFLRMIRSFAITGNDEAWYMLGKKIPVHSDLKGCIDFEEPTTTGSALLASSGFSQPLPNRRCSILFG